MNMASVFLFIYSDIGLKQISGQITGGAAGGPMIGGGGLVYVVEVFTSLLSFW